MRVTDTFIADGSVFVIGVDVIHGKRSLFACNSLHVFTADFQVGNGAEALVVAGDTIIGSGDGVRFGLGFVAVDGKSPTGVPSSLQTDGLLSVGITNDGNGVLEVTNGAKLICGSGADVGRKGKSAGAVRVSGGSAWSVQGGVSIGGEGLGDVTLDASTLSVTADVYVAPTGVLGGSGTVVVGGILQNDGFVSPGITQLAALAPLSPPKRGRTPRATPVTPAGGTLTINGNVVLGPSGVITANAAGSQPGRVVVTGTATLDGTLVLQFMNGFAPKTGDQFDVLHVNGAVTGAFASIDTRGLAPGATFDVTTTGGAFVAKATSDAVALPTVSVKTAKKLAEKSKRPGALTISRSGSTANALTVSYDVGGTATNGIDYILLSGSVTIPAHKKSVKVPVKTVDDTDHEGNETLDVTIVPGADYTHSLKSAARLVIVDND